MKGLVATAAALAAFLVCACGGTRPLPTLEDYSYGTASFVKALEPLFTNGDPVDPGILTREDAARPLRELAARWIAATAPGRMARLRIVDFGHAGPKAATLDVELRLTGVSAADPGERLAAVRRLRLTAVRERPRSGWKIAVSETGGGLEPFQRGRPHLHEEAASRGIVSRHETLDPVESTNACLPAVHHHPGVLLVDVDGDGALDVILPNLRPRLFLNDGTGHFRDATKGSGLDLLPEAEASGGVAADVDGDGLPDLFLTNHDSPCRMLRNDGGGKFHDVTAEWGLEGLSAPFTSAVFLDADRDGRLDLFIACYGDARQAGPAYDGFNGVPDRFFWNAGKGDRPFFVDETSASGLGDAGWGFAVSACDFDDDGDDDLYVANDFGLNSLFENRSTPGHPRFVNVATSSGTEDEGYGMGVTWGDYDGDGRWDLHVADYWTPYRWILSDRRWPMPLLPGAFLARPMMAGIMRRRSAGDALFRNLGDGRFAREAVHAGVDDGGWAWGTEFVDVDGKGREDLLVVNGMFQAKEGGVDDEIAFWNGMGRHGVEFHDGVWGGIDFGANGMASRTPKKLFWNRGDGTFEERAFVEGFDTLEDTRGLAYGDLDGDGAPEIVVSCFRGPVLLYENGWGATSGRIRLLLGISSGFNRDALGAVVRLTAGGRTQLREVRAGSSYLSQSSRELLFGVGRNGGAERVEVRWPDGKREELKNLPAGSRVVWLEGETPRILTGDAAAGARLPR